MYKIVVTTDLSRLPDAVRTMVVEEFDKWNGLLYECGDKKGKRIVDLIRLPPSATTVEPTVFENCNAVICRPTDLLKLKQGHFDEAAKKINIYTVSVGASQFDEDITKNEQFDVFNTHPKSNARGVASFAVLLANKLLSRVAENLDNVKNKEFRNSTVQTTINEKTWVVLGSGEQVARLLEIAVPYGVKKFYIQNDNMNMNRFRNCFKYLAKNYQTSFHIEEELSENELKKLDGDMRAEAELPKASIKIRNSIGGTVDDKIEFFGLRDWDSETGIAAASEADIVSLHIPYLAEEKAGRPANFEHIDAKFLEKFTNCPILINTARGELLKEQDVLDALDKKGGLSGVAIDVVSDEVEASSNYKHSELWSGYVDENGNHKNRNLIVTPHISGAVDTDIKPMWTRILKQIDDKIEELKEKNKEKTTQQGDAA